MATSNWDLENVIYLDIGEIDLLNNTQLLKNMSLDNSKKHFPFELQTKVYCQKWCQIHRKCQQRTKNITRRKKNVMLMSRKKKKKDV